jgi:DNA-binding phage protein
MANDFKELADRTKAGWSDDTQRVYEAASTEFRTEVNEQARIGRALAEARKNRALTQPALSALTGVQQAEISRIESGLGNPTTATISRLAIALDLQFALVPVAH